MTAHTFEGWEADVYELWGEMEHTAGTGERNGEGRPRPVLSAAATADSPGDRSRLTPQALSQEPDRWLHFASSSGEAGRRWVEELWRPACGESMQALTLSLQLLQRRQLAEGRELLDQAAATLRTLSEAPESIVLALEVVYHPVLAYYQYCVEELEEAGQSLVRAEDALAAAIGHERFLLPLAYRCCELRLHHARIARNRRRWDDMSGHIALAWDMIEGRQPFCTLPGGAPDMLSDLLAFFQSLAGLDPQAEESLQGLTDAVLRRSLFERFVNRLYVLPGFVVASS